MTANVWNVASGETLYAGCAPPDEGVPDWAPDLWTIQDGSLNTLNDVKGSDNWSVWLNAWSGIGKAPWVRKSFLKGGGHSPYGVYNAVAEYDYAARLFSKVKSSAPVFHASSEYVADPVTGWMYDSTAGTTVQEGELFAGHHWGNIACAPPSAMEGSGPDGWLVTMGTYAMSDPGQQGTNRAHRLALGESQLYEFLGNSPVAVSTIYGCSLYDSLRNRQVAFPNTTGGIEQTAITYIDWETGESGTIATAGFMSFYACGAYFADEDLYMYSRLHISDGLVMKLANPTTGALYSVTATGTAPTHADMHDGAWDWVEEWQTMIFFPGYGNEIFFLKAPVNPRTQPWVWSKHAFTGTTRVYAGSPPYNRIQYDAASECVHWFSTENAPVQHLRIAAP